MSEIVAHPETNTWILDDWRFKHEYERLRTAFPDADIHRFRIHNSLVSPLSDPSEHDLEGEPMDYEIVNAGNSQELKQLLHMYKS